VVHAVEAAIMAPENRHAAKVSKQTPGTVRGKPRNVPANAGNGRERRRMFKSQARSIERSGTKAKRTKCRYLYGSR
jgi:hypothetical protein